jgi:hypothetical protein
MERPTVQSCLAAPALLSKKPFKISINYRFRLAAGFSHFSYFGRNRPRKRVPKLAQRFAFWSAHSNSAANGHFASCDKGCCGPRRGF